MWIGYRITYHDVSTLGSSQVQNNFIEAGEVLNLRKSNSYKANYYLWNLYSVLLPLCLFSIII
jgi:hypothetical protein